MKTVVVKEATVVYGPSQVESPSILAMSSDVARFVCPIIGNRVVETILVVAVNARNRPQAWSIISTGTPTFCVVSPADILRFVLLCGTPAFFLVHNHPSGECAPSAEDLAFTTNVKSAASIVGLKLIDHVIVSERSHFSFLENQLLEGGVK